VLAIWRSLAVATRRRRVSHMFPAPSRAVTLSHGTPSRSLRVTLTSTATVVLKLIQFSQKVLAFESKQEKRRNLITGNFVMMNIAPHHTATSPYSNSHTRFREGCTTTCITLPLPQVRRRSSKLFFWNLTIMCTLAVHVHTVFPRPIL
jgi:hypothetical protein